MRLPTVSLDGQSSLGVGAVDPGDEPSPIPYLVLTDRLWQTAFLQHSLQAERQGALGRRRGRLAAGDHGREDAGSPRPRATDLCQPPPKLRDGGLPAPESRLEGRLDDAPVADGSQVQERPGHLRYRQRADPGPVACWKAARSMEREKVGADTPGRGGGHLHRPGFDPVQPEKGSGSPVRDDRLRTGPQGGGHQRLAPARPGGAGEVGARQPDCPFLQSDPPADRGGGEPDCERLRPRDDAVLAGRQSLGGEARFDAHTYNQ